MKSSIGILDKIRKEIKKTIVGQDTVIDMLLVTIFSGGHAIIEGAPGLAKTLIINSLARALSLSFNRIQFTPDMVPSDITGTEIINPSAKGERAFRFIEGPIFSNIILADEINRTPPKTQSALLQAMQEKEVTILGKTYEIPKPFFVLATQNPIEYEGTYPLPEAQLDRFSMYIYIDYPTKDEELAIIDVDLSELDNIKPVVSHAELSKMMKQTAEMLLSDKLKNYIVDIVRSTRPSGNNVDTPLDIVKNYIEWGAGPRASKILARTAAAHSFIRGKKLVDKEDVDAVLLPCLKHRIVMNYNSASDGVSVDDVIKEVKKSVEKGL